MHTSQAIQKSSQMFQLKIKAGVDAGWDQSVMGLEEVWGGGNGFVRHPAASIVCFRRLRECDEWVDGLFGLFVSVQKV